MKIFYAVQATGNGHISRSMELLPHLQNYGSVDIFLSGANSTLELNGPVKYRSKGLSLFYTCNGSLHFSRIIRNIAPYRILKEVNELPVEKYQLVINDFDCITSLACARKNIPSVHFGHQASFHSPHTPRPEQRSRTGEWILKHYAKAPVAIGLHFQRYDKFIYPPVIKAEISEAEPRNDGHITVYLPAYCDQELVRYLSPLKDFSFQIFSHQTKQPTTTGNLQFFPVDKKAFNESLISCAGIITGGGFETPAEALYLGKKLIAIPIQGQYEQRCNAAALEKMGVPVLNKLDETLKTTVENWMNTHNIPNVEKNYGTADMVRELMEKVN